jgi:hypothetical protein
VYVVKALGSKLRDDMIRYTMKATLVLLVLYSRRGETLEGGPPSSFIVDPGNQNSEPMITFLCVTLLYFSLG